eukprot:scaffold71566_cov30-Tisochrysis_lutea.AAC.2
MRLPPPPSAASNGSSARLAPTRPPRPQTTRAQNAKGIPPPKWSVVSWLRVELGSARQPSSPQQEPARSKSTSAELDATGSNGSASSLEAERSAMPRE